MCTFILHSQCSQRGCCWKRIQPTSGILGKCGWQILAPTRNPVGDLQPSCVPSSFDHVFHPWIFPFSHYFPSCICHPIPLPTAGMTTSDEAAGRTFCGWNSLGHEKKRLIHGPNSLQLQLLPATNRPTRRSLQRLKFQVSQRGSAP